MRINKLQTQTTADAKPKPTNNYMPTYISIFPGLMQPDIPRHNHIPQFPHAHLRDARSYPAHSFPIPLCASPVRAPLPTPSIPSTRPTNPPTTSITPFTLHYTRSHGHETRKTTIFSQPNEALASLTNPPLSHISSAPCSNRHHATALHST